ncbi:MAG: NADH-quinone oxidoreductase subunit M [Dehalococcoidia bacterium]|nr:NADH-quinone oxidoreductase subunit M [Dehalococcoidia bacterium]
MADGFTGLLTVTVFLPAVAALLLAVGTVRGDRNIRWFAAVVAAADLVLSVIVFVLFRPGGDQFQLVDRFDWISTDTVHASYLLGVDGISAPLVMLTGLLGLCAVFVSFHISHRVREYFIWLFVLQTAVLGVFTALDFLLFFLFWEIELVPMYLLISTWGTGRREYSAMKFLIFTILGSAFMLVAILGVFVSSGVDSFNMTRLLEVGGALDATRAALPMGVLFWLFFIAFAVKLPTWPVHTWLPDAHTDAPTAGSVMLAGVMLKMGGYGLLRVNAAMFPEQLQTYALPVVVLGVISVLYGAVVTLRQTDLKRLIAYSSVSHMGLVLLGLGSVAAVGGALSDAGLTGAAMQLFTHGTITGLLFVAVGILYEKTHTRHIPDLGGLANRMPLVATAFLVAGAASLGLPTLSGFVSELLVFFGGFRAFPALTILAVLGIILAAGYILWMLQRTLFGPRPSRWDDLSDASPVELVPVALLVVSIVVVGVYPAWLTDVFRDGLAPIVSSYNAGIAGVGR